MVLSHSVTAPSFVASTIVLAALLPIQLPANVPAKTAEDGSHAWARAVHVAEPEGIPGSWLWFGPVPTIVAIWGVKQRLEDLPLSPSAFPKHKINILK